MIGLERLRLIRESDLGLDDGPRFMQIITSSYSIHTDLNAWVKDSRNLKVETQIPPDQVKRFYPRAATRKIVCPQVHCVDCLSQRKSSIQDWGFSFARDTKSRSTQQVETINSGSHKTLFTRHKAWLGHRFDSETSNCRSFLQ